jgi:hypothetical protein
VICERCKSNIPENQETTYQGRVLCEDCCFDLMNPPKTCDPTAVHSTLTVRKQLGQTGTDGLSEVQKKIYEIVVEKGPISRDDLLGLLGMTPLEFEREFAVLRHCELLRGFKQASTVYFAKY